jgi:hypothetical protein
MGSALNFLTRYAQERDEFLDSIVPADETWGFSLHTRILAKDKKKSRRCSKGRRQNSMSRGYRSCFQELMNVWTMWATMLKNKVMDSQFIHSVDILNE